MNEKTTHAAPAGCLAPPVAQPARLTQPDDGPAGRSLPAWLIAHLPHAHARADVVAHRAYRIDAVAVDQPALILPLAGAKRVALGGEGACIDPGDYLMIHEAATLQIENLPPGRGGPYRAWAIGFPWRIVDLARTLLSAHAPPAASDRRAPAFTCGAAASLFPALRRLLDAQDSAAPLRDALVDHALLGILIALAGTGDDRFMRASDPSTGARIRLLVAAAPARRWMSADFEQALALSGATLRRRLADERTSLRALLLEARLHHGLALLQTCRKPIKAVAQACGYRSVPSFTRHFVARFGVEPSVVAGG